MMHSFAKLFAALSLIGTANFASANPAGLPKTQLGVGGHPLFKASPYAPLSDEDVLKLLNSKRLNRYRFDVILADDTLSVATTRVQNLIVLSKKYGVRLEPIILLPFSWGDRTDAGKYPAGDPAALYKQGYNRTYAFVSQFGSEIQDWELQNELNLVAKNSAGQIMFGQGWTAAEFEQPVMADWAQVLKGMSDAIDRVNAEKSLKLRRIVGTTSTMFGYLDYMLAKGVKIEVVGYHYYERMNTNPSNYWGGVRPSFNLFEKFASYNRPVHVNELNCAEIYDASFVNETGSPSMNTCNANLDNLLKTFTEQTKANIEAVLVYELLDSTQNIGAEARFGMMYNMGLEKPMMATLAKHAAIANPVAVTPAPVPAPAPAPAVTPVSATVSMSYPAGVAVLKNQMAMSLAPSISGVSAPNCLGILLPQGLTINAQTCVISGKPAYAAGSIPAGGTYVTSTIIELSKNIVSIVTFRIDP